MAKAKGKQRYRCRNPECSRRSFIREYSYRGYLPEVKQQISDMAMNGSGIRDTARVFKISPTTVDVGGMIGVFGETIVRRIARYYPGIEAVIRPLRHNLKKWLKTIQHKHFSHCFSEKAESLMEYELQVSFSTITQLSLWWIVWCFIPSATPIIFEVTTLQDWRTR